MGAKISKRYSTYKSQPKVFKLFLNFLPNGPHKTTFGIFEILKIEILTTLLTSHPMGEKMSKCYPSYKSQPKVLKLVLNVPPNGPHKTTFGIFEILSFWFLTNFFENSKFTIVAYGEIKNLNYLEHERSESKTEWNLGLMGTYTTYKGYLWPFIEVIRCTCHFS